MKAKNLPALKRQFASLLVPNAYGVMCWVQEDLPVANLSCRRVLDNCFDDRLGPLILNNDLNLQLWHKADVVLPASIGFCVSLLPAVATDLRNGHAANAEFGKSVLH